MNKDKQIDSEVDIRDLGNESYIIVVKDQYTDNSLAVTREELEKIIVHGTTILKR